MKQRDAVLVLAAVILAVGVAALLLVGSLAAPARGEFRPRLFFGSRPPPPARSVDLVQQRVPEPARLFVPLERGVSNTARDAAGYLLVLLGVAGALVVAREPVIACYRASLGGWRRHLRILGAGAALVALLASAQFLAFVVLLGTLADNPALRGGPLGLQPLLQVGLVALVVVGVLIGVAAVVGFAAAAWRLGDAVLGVRALARWGSSVPAPLVALVGATLIYLAAQVPVAGGVAALAAIAYALGTVVIARLERAPDQGPTATA